LYENKIKFRNWTMFCDILGNVVKV